MTEERIEVDNVQIQMHAGETSLSAAELVDSIKIRFLSIKTSFTVLKAITIIGKQTKVNPVTEPSVGEHPDRLHVPKPIQ